MIDLTTTAMDPEYLGLLDDIAGQAVSLSARGVVAYSALKEHLFWAGQGQGWRWQEAAASIATLTRCRQIAMSIEALTVTSPGDTPLRVSITIPLGREPNARFDLAFVKRSGRVRFGEHEFAVSIRAYPKQVSEHVLDRVSSKLVLVAQAIEAAIGVLVAVDRLRFQNVALVELIGKLQTPAGLVSGTGELFFVNEAGQAILTGSKPSEFMTSPAWVAACNRAVQSGHATYQTEHGLGFDLRCNVQREVIEPGGLQRTAAAVLTLTTFYAATELDWRDSLKHRYHLSFTELDVIDKLKSGASPSDIALYRHCSIQTIRQHLKNIRKKTGARSIAGILALVSFDQPGDLPK